MYLMFSSYDGRHTIENPIFKIFIPEKADLHT